jgi:hypothetical protein
MEAPLSGRKMQPVVRGCGQVPLVQAQSSALALDSSGRFTST